MAAGDKIVVLEIALPSIYTADIDELREACGSEFDSESDFLLNTIGDPSVVRVRAETMGEKESSITEVWGNIRSAKLADPIPSDDEGNLAEVGFRLMRDEDEGVEDFVTYTWECDSFLWSPCKPKAKGAARYYRCEVKPDAA